jgi:hypothetical protein
VLRGVEFTNTSYEASGSAYTWTCGYDENTRQVSDGSNITSLPEQNYRQTSKILTVPAIQGALASSYRVDRTYDEVGMPLSTTYPATADLPAETIVHEKGRRMTHSLHRPKRLAILATVGATAWLAATLPARLAEMRLAETRRYGPRHYAMANLQWLWLILLAAVVAAWTAERHRAARPISVEVAVSLWAPALILAPVTFPRGDNDGLWGLIYPFIFLSAGATALIVGAAVAVRRGPQGLADP